MGCLCGTRCECRGQTNGQFAKWVYSVVAKSGKMFATLGKRLWSFRDCRHGLNIVCTSESIVHTH